MEKVREYMNCVCRFFLQKSSANENREKEKINSQQNQMKSPNNNHKCLTRIECVKEKKLYIHIPHEKHTTSR